MDYDNMNYAGSNGRSSNNNNGVSDTLTQGLQFQKYLKKISGFGNEPVVEQFSFMTDSEQEERIAELAVLKAQYGELVKNFENSGNTLRYGYERYLASVPTPTFTNKHVRFAGQNGYVTKHGVFKSYDGSGNEFNNVNGCPPTSGRLTVQGGTVSDILLEHGLRKGTAMKDGQSCGDEGSNVFVTEFGELGITYRGCYQSSDAAFVGLTEQVGGAIYNVNSCKNRAVDAGAAVFALKDVDASLNQGRCYTGATFVSPTLLGGVYVGTDVWTSKDTPDLSGNFTTSYYMQLKNGGFISIMDANSNLVKQIPNTGDKDCQNIPKITQFYVTPTTNAAPTNLYNSSLETKLNPSGVPSFSFPINAIYPAAPTTPTNYTLKYTCKGNNNTTVEQTQLITGGVPTTPITITACSPVNSSQNDCTNYYLILQDGGRIEINKGSGPPTSGSSTPQSSSAYNQTYDVGNSVTDDILKTLYPLYVKATVGNYISHNTPLLQNQYIISNDGKLVLMMQPDGHLVLKTFKKKFNCVTRTQDNQTYGRSDAYALYNISSSIDNSNIGKLAYIDDDGYRHVYPSSMISREKNEYKRLLNINSVGNDLKVIEKTTNIKCEQESSDNVNSGGYVYDNNTGTCYIKNNSFNLRTPKTHAENFNLNVKLPVLIAPISCSDRYTEIDITRWSKYQPGEIMSSSFNCGAAKQYSREQVNVRTTEKDLYNMAIDIVNKMNYLQTHGVTLSADMVRFKTQLQGSIAAYNKPTENDNVINSALSGMMGDADLMVLQENTRYLFLSIFAVGVMVVALNAIKK
jgi:hypothetical protein